MFFRLHLPAVMAAALAIAIPHGSFAFELAIDAKAPPSQAAAVPAPPAQIDAAVAKLDELAAEIMRKSGIPGMSVAVVRDGNIVTSRTPDDLPDFMQGIFAALAEPVQARA